MLTAIVQLCALVALVLGAAMLFGGWGAVMALAVVALLVTDEIEKGGP